MKVRDPFTVGMFCGLAKSVEDTTDGTLSHLLNQSSHDVDHKANACILMKRIEISCAAHQLIVPDEMTYIEINALESIAPDARRLSTSAEAFFDEYALSAFPNRELTGHYKILLIRFIHERATLLRWILDLPPINEN